MAFSAASSPIRTLLVTAAVFVFFFTSCTIVKNAPQNKPFVYETTVSLPQSFTKKEKRDLSLELMQQVHDSMKVRSVRKFFVIRKGLPYLFANQIVDPAVYDSLNADKTIGFMRAYLNAQGYYRDSIRYTAKIDSAKTELRTRVHFEVVRASLFRFDSIVFNLLQDTGQSQQSSEASRLRLQRITDSVAPQSLVKKGEPFSQAVLAAEINRLSEVYRNSGFLKFSSEEFLVLWDTVGLALIRPTLDPIEQARQLEELRRRRQNPKVDIEFRMREVEDTARLTTYSIGQVRVFPDVTADTALFIANRDTVQGYEFVSYRNLFRPKKLTEYIYLKEGDLYRESNFVRTRNRFSGLNSWRLVNITPATRPGRDTVDFDINLTPASRYFFSANLESSRNLTPLVTTGNLIGVGAVVSVLNRNFLRGANQFSNNARIGWEFNSGNSQSVLQTLQFSYSGNIRFPRKVPGSMRTLFPNETVSTILSGNFAFTNRLDYFTVRTFNTSWGYETSWKNKLLNVRFPNIENNFLSRGRLLDTLIKTNRSYTYIFNRGLILSTIFNFTWARGKRNRTHLITASLEPAGFLASTFIRNDPGANPLYRFLRLDFEYRYTYNFRRSAFATRFFAGGGWSRPIHEKDSANFFLPFFRQYVAGGPNSMRAWGIRRLGPGSSVKSFASTDAPDRFGDMRLEMNAEYRFFIASISTFTLNGALFADMGNVWFLRPNPDFPNGHFRLSRLWNDVAIGTGTGLRIDFSSFLKIRFDYAFKVKNPTPDVANIAEQNQWFYKWQLGGGQLQFGIDYPF